MAQTVLSLANAMKERWAEPMAKRGFQFELEDAELKELKNFVNAKDLEFAGAAADWRSAASRQFLVDPRPMFPRPLNRRSKKTRRTGLSYRQRQARGRSARSG